MQIKIDLPETLALQVLQGDYSPTEIIEQGLHWLGIEAEESNAPSPQSPDRRLPDWSQPQPQPDATEEEQFPDLMEFLDDLSQRRSRLIDKLRKPPEKG